MKCSACKKNRCDREYDKRYHCLGEKEGIDCTCTCQVSDLETVVTSAVSVAGGVALMAGSFAVAASPLGIFAPPLAGACMGAGGSMIVNPMIKKFNGEHMTLGSSARDFAVGAVAGAASGTVVGCYNSIAAGEAFQTECFIKALGAAGALALATSIKECGKQ